MLVKIITLFLVAMMLLGMVGKLLYPDRRKSGRKPARFCPDCGRPTLGKGPCACRKGA